MAITVQQIPGAITTTQSLMSTLQNISALLNQAQNLSNAGWQINIGTTTPIEVAVPVASQSALVAQYDALKTQLVTTFGALP